MRALRDDVLKALEEARNTGKIGKSNDAMINIDIFDNETSKMFDSLNETDLPIIFIVSKVVKNKDLVGFKGKVSNILVEKADGVRCDRCWNFFEHSKIIEENGLKLCKRCHKIINK